ncbi:transcriptional regulator [Streptomyces poriferorum]|uniref:Transcriptional regulator n=1 Tax=Streptomyces poriferorum TaxID=2798799 RepID=A0ABY9IRJ1_9ACTN|nr:MULTISPECIES: transcriptional regulator [unclassified Streptomyces]MDP5313069.1 transcriptional regulator [Streptomyces sp. Alt4]WLQ57932.1 transcriptional regulator [Streptomyces sp. Alt2]
MPTERIVDGAGFNELMHHPSRLAVLAFLSGCVEADFGLVRDRCELSDSALSKIAKTLEEAGYIDVKKGRAGRKARTWLALTPEGGNALAAHLDALQAVAAAARSAAEHEADANRQAG